MMMIMIMMTMIMMTMIMMTMMMVKIMMMIMIMDTLHKAQHEFLQLLAPSSLDILQYPETDFLTH